MLDDLKFEHELEGGDLVTNNSYLGFQDFLDKLDCSFRLNDKDESLPLEYRIALRLMGTKQIRLPGFPGDMQEELASKIKLFTDKGLVIPLLTASGSRKYGKMNINHNDPAEFSSLLMLHTLGKAVSEIYRPGIMSYIVQEDTGGKYLNSGYPNNQKSIDTYSKLFSLLSKEGEISSNVTSVKESELLSLLGGEEEFDTLVKQYHPLFVSYLSASDATDESQWEKLESYSTLGDIGWMGTINRGMRDYYYKRVGFVYGLGDDSLQEKQDHLAKLFSAVLARKKLGVTSDLSLLSDDYEGLDANALRFSFAAPTPGMPTKGGRLFYRSLSRKICSSAIPYWAGHGVMLKKNGMNLPGIRNRHKPLKNKERELVRGKITFADTGLQIGGDIIR